MQQHEIDARIVEVDAHARESSCVTDVIARHRDLDGFSQQCLRQAGQPLAFVGVGLGENERFCVVPLAGLIRLLTRNRERDFLACHDYTVGSALYW